MTVREDEQGDRRIKRVHIWCEYDKQYSWMNIEERKSTQERERAEKGKVDEINEQNSICNERNLVSSIWVSEDGIRHKRATMKW